MLNLQANFERILYKLRNVFKNSFCSAHIIDSDALAIANCINENIEIDPDEICAKACALASELENLNQEVSKKGYGTAVVKNKEFLYIFSKIHENLKLIMILKNNDNDFTLNNVEKISKEIGQMVSNMMFDEKKINDILSDVETFESSDKLHVLDSEDILIRKIIFELKNIITPATYKTRLIRDFNTNSININSNNENLRFILRLIKLLKNNFTLNLR